MSNKHFRILFLFILIGLTGESFAQKAMKPTPGNPLIKDEFFNNIPLVDVLAAMEKKYKLKIDYDKEEVKPYTITYWFTNETFLDGLKAVFKKVPLKFYLDENDVIHIAGKNKKIETVVDRKFDGQPTRADFTLTGRIVDATSGENLPFATVAIKGAKAGSQTNVDGHFTLLKVPTDTVTLEVSYVGFVTRLFHLNPKLNLEDLKIEIEPAIGTLEEVTVMEKKTEVLKANEIVGMIKMTPRNIARLPNVGERDPFRAFQLMPGVSASNESSSGLYVRGGTPDQTLVLYDGFTVYHVDHLFGFFSAFNYNAIKDIQLYKGGFDARFGGRISAVAEITGKEGNKKEFNAGVDVSLLSTNAYIETPLGEKFTFLVAGRRSWKGPLYKKLFERFTSENSNQNQPATGLPGGSGRNPFGSFGQQQVASSYFYDLNSKLTYRPTKNDIVSLSLYNGTDNMDNSSSSSLTGFGRPGGGFGGGRGFNTATNDVSNWGNLGGSLKWSRQWGDKFYSNALISYSNYYSNRDNSRLMTITRDSVDRDVRIGQIEDNNLSDVTAKMDFEWKLLPNNQLDFGWQATRNNIKYTYSQNDTIKVLDRNDTGSTYTAYVQDQIKIFGSRLHINPGIRMTYFDVTQKNYFEPRFSANFNLTQKLKLKGAAGIYYQFVKQINREDISQGNRNFWVLSNSSTLPVTRSKHLILGGSYETSDYLIDVEFYQKKSTDVTEYTLRFVPQLNRMLAASETFFNGDETINGVDVLIQKKFGDFNGWIGYTLAEAKRKISAFSDKPYYSDQDVRHQFKIVGSYKYKKWDFAATWIYSTGRPYTSILGAYQVTLLDGTVRNFTNPSDKNANRFPAYHRMDVSATYNFSPRFNVGFSVFNLYNRTNVWYKRFQVITDDDLTILQTTNVNYLGFTPNVTITWKLK
ncbi:TonB-dependent receptor domain-containing protein [Emticicia sp. 21SJ11W-3]|uniref:TonB-dependent receptor domain-containing protein n=1 Tax=Emticicia sp. 21SJ11W-3 TaxID=2916755 RepID=UPI00209CC3C0|nr:TonB-dependent receptor [Emticicia sp. 21SJ11W-3]UTA69791.1 TonB-dependent receptor [Emticicia sp. 21SJ11W-3]